MKLLTFATLLTLPAALLAQVIPTVGAPELHPRLSIQALHDEPEIYNMFLLGTAALMRTPETSPASYFGLSGIHGRPNIPYNDAPSTDIQPYGYCLHRSVLFTTWHRVYMAHFEQLLTAAAVAEARKWPEGEDRDKWTEAAKKVRQPYWDWSHPVDGLNFPSEYEQEEVEVSTPEGQETIPNPLAKYTFDPARREQRLIDFAGSRFRNADTTVRDISNSLRGDTGALKTRTDTTYKLFSVSSFSYFSTSTFPRGDATPADTVNVEGLHDGVHVEIGGHMVEVPVAAFDPTFWLHHTNVDRLVALYQAANPESAKGNKALVEPMDPGRPSFGFPVSEGHTETATTPLYPFKKENGEDWTSADVSSVKSTYALGYYYPELPEALENSSDADITAHALEQIDALYAPAQQATGGSANGVSANAETKIASGPIKSTEWLATVTFDGSEIDETFTVKVFDGDSQIGGVTSFSTTGSQMAMGNSTTAGSVPLTGFLLEEKVNYNDIEKTVEHLKKNLKWRITDYKGDELDVADLPSLQVSVSASQVLQGAGSALPVFGKWSTFYEVTDKKKGGATFGNVELGSEDVNAVNDRTVLAKPEVPK